MCVVPGSYHGAGHRSTRSCQRCVGEGCNRGSRGAILWRRCRIVRLGRFFGIKKWRGRGCVWRCSTTDVVNYVSYACGCTYGADKIVNYFDFNDGHFDIIVKLDTRAMLEKRECW